MGGGDSGEGREGDWECSGCRNRNYAFRSFCNRCKQPRLLVDYKTPPNSKWLPRVGDWICSGCTNNNYASREKCKKCGQPKELAAMPAFAMPGASLQTHPHYFPRAQGGQEQNLNLGFLGNGAFQQSQPLGSSWPFGGADNYGIQPAGKFGVQSVSTWPFGGNHSSGVPYGNQVSQVMVPKGWRNGDWICTCGFHNYSSRAECKKCNAAMPPALGTKRLASEDLVQDWDNKRLNAGQQAYTTFGQLASSVANQTTLGQLASSVANQTRLGQLASSVANQTTLGQLASSVANQTTLGQLASSVATQTTFGQLASSVATQTTFGQLASSVANQTTVGQVASSVAHQTTAAYSTYPAGSSIAVPNLQVNPQLPQLVTVPALPGKGARQWRDGDWMCTNCSNHNYASRSHCNKCQTQREELTQPVSVA